MFLRMSPRSSRKRQGRAGSAGNDAIVRALQLSRTLIGPAVGSALGLGGAVTQALTRNHSPTPACLA